MALLAGCQSRGSDGAPAGTEADTPTRTPAQSEPSEPDEPTATDTTAAASVTPTPAAETVAVTPAPDLPDLLLVNERPGTVNVDLEIESVASGGATVRSRVFMTEEDTDGVGLPPGEVRVVVATDGPSATERFETTPDRTLVVRIYPDRIEFATVARE